MVRLGQLAQAAQPPRPCITDSEMHGLVAYFLPAVIDEVTRGCTPHLQANSYMRSGMTVLRGSLGQGKEAAWPAARAAFFKMSDAADEKTMAGLSDKALRPLVDEMLAGKMAIPVDAPKCQEINGIAEALLTTAFSG